MNEVNIKLQKCLKFERTKYLVKPFYLRLVAFPWNSYLKYLILLYGPWRKYIIPEPRKKYPVNFSNFNLGKFGISFAAKINDPGMLIKNLPNLYTGELFTGFFWGIAIVWK